MDQERGSQRPPELSPQQQDYIEVEHHCCLCGEGLEFEHKIEDLNLKVIEKAQCPRCKVQLKEREHALH